jgi:hypothetical protein
MGKENGVLDYVQRLGVCSNDVREGWTKLLGRSHTPKIQFDRQRRCNCLEFFDCFSVEWMVWIPQDRDSSQLWLHFFKELQPMMGCGYAPIRLIP